LPTIPLTASRFALRHLLPANTIAKAEIVLRDIAVQREVTFLLTNVPISVTNLESRSRKGRQPVTSAGGAKAVPAGGGSSPPLSGGSGTIRPAGMMTGLRGHSLDWDRKERVTPVESARSFEPSGSCVRPSPRKRVSGAELWRSLAAASAVVERRQASALR
jgi:hypothetical protein